MGYIPPPAPPRLNLDSRGMPKDYATYVWLLYGHAVEDDSPARRAFLYGSGKGGWEHPSLGLQVVRR